MPAWYVFGAKVNSNYTEQLHQVSNAQGVTEEGLQLDPRTAVIGGRVHGNPHIDYSDLGLQASPGKMREQVGVWGNQIGPGDSSKYKTYLENFASAWDNNEALEIIDSDDPTLVEHGEAYVHRLLADYVSEPMLAPEETMAPWVPLIRLYLDTIFLTTIAKGHVPGAPTFEPARQRFGLPYEWHGAAVD